MARQQKYRCPCLFSNEVYATRGGAPQSTHTIRSFPRPIGRASLRSRGNPGFHLDSAGRTQGGMDRKRGTPKPDTQRRKQKGAFWCGRKFQDKKATINSKIWELNNKYHELCEDYKTSMKYVQGKTNHALFVIWGDMLRDGSPRSQRKRSPNVLLRSHPPAGHRENQPDTIGCPLGSHRWACRRSYAPNRRATFRFKHTTRVPIGIEKKMYNKRPKKYRTNSIMSAHRTHRSCRRELRRCGRCGAGAQDPRGGGSATSPVTL